MRNAHWGRVLLAALLAVDAALGSASAVYGQGWGGPGYGMGPGMMWGYGDGGWGLFGVLQMLLWWVFIILGIVVLVRWLFGAGRGRAPPSPEDRALTILRERYARGEIGKEEFEQKRRDIGAAG